MKIRAIETEFDGVMYRSRLEAQTALFLKKLHLKYLYEPHVIDLGDGVNYVPDFYLPDIDTYIEVKGGHNERLDKWEKFVELREKELIEKHGDAFSFNGRNILIKETGIDNKNINIIFCSSCEKKSFLDFVNDLYICPSCNKHYSDEELDAATTYYFNIDHKSMGASITEKFLMCRNSSARYDRGIR